MRQSKRRLILTLVLLCFIALFVWRILHVPYRPELLYRAIPENAILVSEHDQLAQRWLELTDNPLVLDVARNFGASNKDLNELKANIAIPAILNRFAADKTIIAYVPWLGHTGKPAWILASWGGVETQLLKWGFYNPLLSDFEKIEMADGRHGWVMENAVGSDLIAHLSMAVTEGVLLATLSASRQGASVLIDRIERHSKPNPEIQEAFDRDPVLQEAQDRGWIGMNDLVGASWMCEFVIDGDAVLEGAFSGKARLLPAGESASMTERLPELEPILKDAPGSLIITPFEVLQSLFSPRGSTARIRYVADQLAPHVAGGPSACVMLCAPKYYGRIMGIKASTVILALKLEAPQRLEETVASVLDGVNAEFNTTLIRRDPRDGLAISVIESVRKGPLTLLGANERPAYVVVGDWLLMSSNYAALKKLMRSESTDFEWSAALNAHQGEVCAWLDLKMAADSVNKIAAVMDLVAIYDLFETMKGARRKKSFVREHFAVAQEWLGTMENLERFTLWGSSTADGCKGNFRLGSPDSSK